MKWCIDISSIDDGSCTCYFYIDGVKKRFEELDPELQKATADALRQCSDYFMEAAFHDKEFSS